MTSQLRQNVQASQGIEWGWWRHNSALLDPGRFSEHLWSPSWCSYLLKRAGVTNLIQLTLMVLDLRPLVANGRLEPFNCFEVFRIFKTPIVIFRSRTRLEPLTRLWWTRPPSWPRPTSAWTPPWPSSQKIKSKIKFLNRPKSLDMIALL